LTLTLIFHCLSLTKSLHNELWGICLINGGSMSGRSWLSKPELTTLESKITLGPIGPVSLTQGFPNPELYDDGMLRPLVHLILNFSLGQSYGKKVSDREKVELQVILDTRIEEIFLLVTQITPSCLTIYIWTPYPTVKGSMNWPQTAVSLLLWLHFTHAQTSSQKSCAFPSFFFVQPALST
jgi:hypothetical protein